jgi:hypothetical protein
MTAETLFDRIVVWRVRRQENEKTSYMFRVLSAWDRNMNIVLDLSAPQLLAKLHSYE